jgi:hypothetical protein
MASLLSVFALLASESKQPDDHRQQNAQDNAGHKRKGNSHIASVKIEVTRQMADKRNVL